MSLTSANYNVTGNPSITSNYILTPTDENSYITSSVSTPANSEFDIYTKVTAIDLQGVVGTYFISILMSSDPTTSVSVGTQFRYPNIFTAVSNIEGVQDSTSTYGPSVSANTDYWIRLHVSSPATHKLTLYAIADNNYTRDTLPSTGWYVSQDIDVSSSIYTGRQVRLGWGNLISEVNPASISMDLKETFISVQGNVVWEAVQTVSSLPSKGYTNYTIIGDPTYNSGVYSDFRHDRYLQFPQDLKGTDKTYIVKFTTGSAVDGRQFIVNAYKFFTLCLYENYVCLLDWADNAEFNHLFAPATNTTYYVKAAYNGSTVTVSHSMDGTSWVQDLQYTYSELVTSKDQYGFSIGNHPVWTTSPFRGSIDLNDFYVLDTATQKVLWMPSTKIKSVVHGLVYGNPTISDAGILSNISTTNYLKVSTPVAQDYNTLEIGLKVITSNLPVTTQYMWTDNAGFRINGVSCQLGYYDPDTSTSTSITVLRWNALSNTEYWLKLTHDGTTYEFSYSTDGVNYTTLSYESSTKLTINQLFTFGSTISTSADQSSLDLSKMYIKVNGQEIWKAWHSEADYQGGSVDISEGFYSNGINEIIMSPTNFGINSLKSGQIVGNQNKVYVASTNNVNSLHLVGNDATEQALKGTYDVYAALDQPVYLSYAENYLTSGDAGDISQAEFSYTASPASVTIPKLFWYDSTSHNSYWYPQSVTVALADAKAEQTLGDVNSVFVTNELGQDVSGITFTNGTVQGNYVSSAKAPGQNVYLDHKTHAKILGVQGAPDEIVVEGSSGGSVTTNYTVVGSPTVDSNYVASGFSSRNCVAATETLDTSTSWSIFTKVTTSSDVSTRQKFVGCASSADQKVPTLEFRNSVVWVCIPNSSGSGWLAEASTGFTPSANTTYWFEISWDGSVYYVKVSTDGTNYTQIYTNTSSEAAYHSDSYKVCFGNDLYAYNEQLPFLGSVDLKECYFKDSSDITWRAVGNPIFTQVSIGTSDNWTALQNRTYWYEEGNTTDVSDLTSDTYEADLKGYLIFSEDANEDLIVKGYTSAYTVTTYNTPDVYSGYSYTVTDSTGTTIDSFGKTGTLCKAYTIPAMAGLKFVFIPAEDLEDGHVYEAGDIREAYSETNGTPFRQLDESTEDYTYNASTDTLTDENEGELTCIGHVYVEWNDIAE